MKRWISLLLALVMLFQTVPVTTPAVAAESGDVKVTQLRFYSNSKSSEYKVLDSGGGIVDVDYIGNSNPYKFEIDFNYPQKVGYAFVVGTADGETLVMDAVYSESAGCFVAEGYFTSSDKFWSPTQLQVCFTPKPTAPEVGSAVDWDQMMDYLGDDLVKAAVTETTEGNTTTGTVDLSDTVDALKDLDMGYVIKKVDSTMGSDVSTMRDYYNSASNVLAYVVPGVDDTRYYAYLDFSDPDSVKMMLDDGLDAGANLIEMSMEFMDENGDAYQNLETVSKALSDAAPILDVMGETYDIHQEMDDLRTEIESADHIRDKAAALEAVDALEQDQIAFALMVALLPAIATGGMAAGASAALFTGIIGIMSKASDIIYSHRAASIVGESMESNWSNVVCGTYLCAEEYGVLDSHFTHYWEYNRSSHTLVVRAHPGINEMPGPFAGDDAKYANTYEGALECMLDAQTFIVAADAYFVPRTPWNVMEVKIADSHTDAGGFDNCQYLESVDLPDALEVIFGGMFTNCRMLKHISIPASVEEISKGYDSENNAIYPVVNCPMLSDIYYEGSMGQWDAIEGWGFLESEYNIRFAETSGWHGENIDWYFDEYSDTLTLSGQGDMAAIGTRWRDYIEDGSVESENFWYYPWFRVSDRIRKIVVEEGITGICDKAFTELPALEEVVLPDSLTAIGKSAFSKCPKLKSVTIPGSVEYIGDYAFQMCTGLESVTVEPGVTEIPMYCFNKCTSLAQISLPEGLERIRPYALDGCSALKKLVIPKGVTGMGTLDDCTALETLTIPASVTSLYAFINCPSLKEIHYGSSCSDWSVKGGDEIIEAYHPTMHYTSEGFCGAYGSDIIWDFQESTGKLILEGSGEMKAYDNDYFSDRWYRAPWSDYRNEIKTVEIGEGITRIGLGAFGSDMTDKELNYPILTSVSLPNSVQWINSYAFAGCTALTAITIPSGVESMNENLFLNCENLSAIYFEGDAPDIDYNTFTGVTADAYYPADNDTWTEDLLKNYGGKLLWEPTGKPEAPVVVSENNSAGQIRLAWEHTRMAAKYQIYRKTGSDGSYQYYKSTTRDYFVDTGAELGQKYYYRVRAVDAFGEKSGYAKTVSGTAKLAKPSIELTNVSSTGKIKVNWEPIEGAVKYYVYRKDSSDGSYKFLKSTTGTYLTDSTAVAGTKYYYRIKAVHSNTAANSAYSSGRSCICDLAKPEISITRSNGDPKVTWKTVEGAEKYEIWRATSKSGTYKKVKTAITARSYTDTSATAGKTYYYKIRAIHSNSAANSAWSSVKSIAAK